MTNTTENKSRRLVTAAVLLFATALTTLAVRQNIATLLAISQDARPAGIPELEQNLSGSPLQPRQWLLLAQARQERGDLTGAKQALRLSMLSGDVDPAIMNSRLILALNLSNLDNPAAIPEEERRLMNRQIRQTYLISPMAVSEILQSDRRKADLIRPVLETLSPTDIDILVKLHAMH